ncbi:MAG: serine/threonine-protein phosphatase [Gammaproteobacteria bacterium]|nr:serine/threonine-protein phosphatase [Gammaproteobacteria bacterium]
MKPTAIDIASRTDKGLLRDNNEDALASFPEHGLVVLADGMGGYASGEVASHLAVETVGTMLLLDSRGATLRAAVEAANTAILQAIDKRPDYEGMGTTLVVATFQDQRVRYAHVGDSRIYRLRGGRLEQLTRDHSIIQELVDQGFFESIDEARSAGVKNNIVTRGLGITHEIEVETGVSEVHSGDLYLLCSDGLSDMVADQVLEETLCDGGRDLSETCDRLLDLAIGMGGRDNISLVLVRPVIKA